jgi:hypothetical protein
MNIVSNKSLNRAWTIFELLALLFVVFVPIAIGNLAARHFGRGGGIVAGTIAAVICVSFTVLLYRANGRRLEQQRRELRDKYKRIYRVIAVPTGAVVVRKPKDAEIKAGDFGWEALPLRADGLIYLQGLSPQWRVVWHAGFRPDQIEEVTSKPRSQYDWNYTWLQHPPPCPFPVQERSTATLGLPHVSEGKRC